MGKFTDHHMCRIYLPPYTYINYVTCILQAKSYARNNTEKQEVDRSSVLEISTISSLTDPLNTSIPFLAIFLLSNLLILALTLLNIHKLCHRLQRQEKKIIAVYKGSAIVLTCLNLIALVTDIFILKTTSIRHFIDIFKGAHGLPINQKIMILSCLIRLMPYAAKVLLVCLILCLETPVVCYYTHKTNSRRWYKVSHAFALCQIIWFVHRFVNDVIISVVFFVLAPAQSLAVIALLLFTIGSAIAFVAFIIYKGCNRSICRFMCCVALNGIMVCGLLFAITLLYIIFVDIGLKSTGIGGLVLSLVPPFIVSVLFYIVKQKYFKDKSFSWITALICGEQQEQEANQTTAGIQVDDNEEPQEATPLIQVEVIPQPYNTLD